MSKPHRYKNVQLEKAKKVIAKIKGYASWNELRLNTNLKDCFILLHEACEIAINQTKTNYENQINALKKSRKETKNRSLQDEIRRCFPVDRVG